MIRAESEDDLMRRAILFVILLVLAFSCCSPAHAEGTFWVCPQCGKPDNKENYCEKCACPSPAPEPEITPTPKPETTPTPVPEKKATQKSTPKSSGPLKITKVKYLGEGKVQINWTGKDYAVKAAAYFYENSKHNSGIENINLLNGDGWQDGAKLNSGWRTDALSGVIGYLAPGRRYWICLTNKSKESVWYDCSIPVGDKTKSGFSVTMDKVVFGAKNTTGKWETVRTPSIEIIEKACKNSSSYDKKASKLQIKYYLTIKKLKNPASWYTFILFLMPDGKPYVVKNAYKAFDSKTTGAQNYTIDINWNEIYKKYGKIPTGTYTFMIGLGKKGASDYVIGSCKFNIISEAALKPVVGKQGMSDEEKILAIKENILFGKEYDQNLDVNGDGQISVSDYVEVRRKQINGN